MALATPIIAAPPQAGAFRLRRHFSIASGVAILLVTVLLSVRFYQYEVGDEVASTEARNLAMARTIANAIWPSYSEQLRRPVVSGDALRSDPGTEALHRTLQSVTRGVPVIKIKIYEPHGISIYSSVPAEIGEDESDNLGFRKAVAGEILSELTHRGSMSVTEGRIENVDVVSTYIPVRGEDGTTQAVFELYSDITDSVADIRASTLRLVAALVIVFALLYAVLLYVVARADVILQRQYRQLRDNERLMQVQNRELDAANRAKNDFLSSTSHELRTPMNAILGFAQLLDSEPGGALSENQRRFVQQILKAGRHLLELINEVLDLARIEAGKLTLSIEPVPVAAVISECLPLVQTLAAERAITVEAADPGTLCVMADYMRLKQALLNLLSNAVKYNKRSGSVKLSLESLAGKRVRISVADTGIGIREAERARIFQPFQRLAANTNEIEGTSIGLALTRKLVLAMGGDIGFSSEADKGSTFWIVLTAATPDALSMPQQAEQPRIEPQAGAEGRLLLYIEDNPANVMLMEHVARRNGLRFLSAHNAELGVAIAGLYQPDVIVMDLNLPGIDGYEALKRLRENAVTAAIPVMALTASAAQKDVARGLEAGFSRYLTKPIDMRELTDAIGEALGAGHA